MSLTPAAGAELALAALSLLIWLHLLFARRGFWRARERDDRDPPRDPKTAPSVVAVVPARDEAEVIETCVESLLSQDYRGPFRVILVDDESSDGTGEIALATARRLGAGDRLEVVRGAAPPPGWTGKLAAAARGVAVAEAGAPDYLLLTDADIAHAPDNLRRLVARAEAEDRVLVSLMAKLRCESFAERLMIPAFVYFFAMLYPFAAVNDRRSKVAAAAGGCMLARRDALDRAGGLAAIRGAIIDDCALGRLLKEQGPIWLGLTDRAFSLRPYPDLAAVGRMISRSAYAQLRYSPALLAGTLLGLALMFLTPPVLAVFGQGLARHFAICAYALMALSLQPMLAFYRRSPLWGLALPAIGLVYAAYTFVSALDVWRGRGGLWKGRVQARRESAA